MTKRSLVSRLLIAASSAGMLLILAIVLYTARNDSGHTGFNPYLALILFAPLAAAGLAYGVATFRKRSGMWPGFIAVCVGLAGILLLVYLDWTNTLLEYGVWIDRGMPGKGLK